jgi:hypothetical protein
MLFDRPVSGERVSTNKQPIPEPSAAAVLAAMHDDVEAQRKWWREQWLAFPTVSEDDDGGFDFWDVAPDTGVYQDDWPRGERLARDTIAQMREFPEGASVLRRIIPLLDPDSTVAQGFINRIEDNLSRPDLYPAD